jgi:hypothetical protein
MVMSIVKGYDPEVCVQLGLMAAAHSLQSQDAIAHSLIPNNFAVDAIRDSAQGKPKEIDISHLR